MATKNNITQVNRLPKPIQQFAQGDVWDKENFVPNTKLYAYNWFGITQVGGSIQPTEEQTLEDFLRKVYQQSILLDQYNYLASSNGSNKTYVELEMALGLSYAEENPEKRYIDAMLIKSDNNYFWQQAQSFAEYLNPKEYNVYLIRKEDYNNVNSMKFWTIGEDVLTLNLEKGERIPSEYSIYVTDAVNQTTINADGSFQYVMLFIKKVVPYITGNNSSQKVWTVFYQNSPINEPISYIDIEYEGHNFIINRLFFFDQRMNVIPLDYEILEGDNLRLIDFIPEPVLNTIYWTSNGLRSLETHWLVWLYSQPIRNARLFKIFTQSGTYSEQGVTDGINPGSTFDGMMVSRTDERQSIPSRITTNWLEKYVPTDADYDGYGSYLLFFFKGTTGGQTGFSDGGTQSMIIDMIYRLVEVIKYNATTVYNYYDFYNTPKPQDINDKIKLEKPQGADNADNTNGGWFGYINNSLRYVTDVIKVRAMNSALFGNSNLGISTGNIAFRPYQQVQTYWKKQAALSYYLLDSSARLAIQELGLGKSYLGIISKPVRTTKDFANKQRIGNNYYWDSKTEKLQNSLSMIGKGNLFIDGEGNMFPSYFSSIKYDSETKKLISGAVEQSGSTMVPYLCLTPNTPEELLQNWDFYGGQDGNKAIRDSINLPLNALIITPEWSVVSNNDMYNDNTFFKLDPKKSDSNNGKPFRMRLKFRNSLALDAGYKRVGNITGYSILDYGGVSRNIKFYGNNNNLIYETGRTLSSVYTNPLKASETKVFGTRLLSQDIDFQDPFVAIVSETEVTTNSAKFNLRFANFYNKPIINLNVVVKETETGNTVGNVSITEPNPNRLYYLDITGLTSITNYDLDITFDYIDEGVTKTGLPYSTSFVTVPLEPSVTAFQVTETGVTTIRTRVSINTNGTNVTGGFGTATSPNGDTIQSNYINLISVVGNVAIFQVDWVNNLETDLIYTIKYTVNYEDKGYQATYESTEFLAGTGSADSPNERIILSIVGIETLEITGQKNNWTDVTYRNSDNRTDVVRDPYLLTTGSPYEFTLTQGIQNQWEALNVSEINNNTGYRWDFVVEHNSETRLQSSTILIASSFGYRLFTQGGNENLTLEWGYYGIVGIEGPWGWGTQRKVYQYEAGLSNIANMNFRNQIFIDWSVQRNAVHKRVSTNNHSITLKFIRTQIL